ncbi:MAG: MFS transporter, partial [Dehalococcoidales bacterium]|nr:MFS transporter [Dehalococcoidales bacterium]
MKRLHYGWVIAALGAAIFSFYSMRFNTFGVFLLPITKQLDLDRGAISWAPSIASAFSAVVSLVSGRLSDKYGPRYLVTAAGLMIGGGFLLMSQVTELWHVLLAWGLTMGGAQALIYIPIISSVPRWFAVKQSTAIGIAVVGFGLGAAVWPPVTQLLIDAFTWQKACIILGITNIIAITVMAQFLKKDPGEMGIPPYGAALPRNEKSAMPVNTGMSLKDAIKTPGFWLFGGALLGFFSCLNVMYVHIVAHARDIGISPIVAASAVSIIGATSIIGRLSIGPISDKLGTRAALCISLIFAVTGMALLVWSPGEWSFFIFTVIFGLAYGTFVPMETAVPSGMFGVRSLGTIMAVLGLFTNLGITLAPPLAGAIFDATGQYKIAFIICLGLATMGLVLSI